MSEPAATSLDVALQEWAVACEALAAGELCLAVRKGGIHEPRRGLFTLAHRRFLLAPTWLHQDPARLREPYAGRCRALGGDADPDHLVLPLWAEADRLWRVADLDRVLDLGDELIWDRAELERRFAYRGEPWLAVVALRVHRLERPARLAWESRYGGCRSWIRLAAPVDVSASRPVLDEEAWRRRLDAIAAALEGA